MLDCPETVLPSLKHLDFASAASSVHSLKNGPAVGPRGMSEALRSITHDACSALGLAQQQIAEPVRTQSLLLVSLALLALAVLLVWPVRLWLLCWTGRLIRRFDRRGHCHAQVIAVATIILTVLLTTFGVRLLRAAVDARFVLLAPVAALADTVASGLVVTGLGLGIGRALRSPDDPGEGPLAVPEKLSVAVGFYPLAGGIMLGLAGVVEHALRLLHASQASWTIAHTLLIFVEAGLAIALLIAIGRSREADDNVAGAQPSGSTWLTSLAWAAIIVGLIALLLGHVTLAALLFQELIWVSLVTVTAILFIQLLEAAIGWLLGSEHAAGHFATHIVGLRAERIGQFSILAKGLANVVVWSLVIGLIAAPLGGMGGSLVDQVQPGLLLDELRSLHFAPETLAIALVLLVAGLTLTRILRRWMEQSFLPATALDVGVRTSLVMGLNYAGVLLALLAATTALGINLDKITLIASALSVGIGFGLQSIIQNFVSGVILLIERPIKIGDWVTVSGAEGTVRRINVRATELGMANGSVAIVPNSSFISGNVQNRVGGDFGAPIELTIKLANAGSPDKARDTLLALIEDNENILEKPRPGLLFTDVSDDIYGFALHAYGKPGKQIAEVRSDLLYRLVQALASAGIKATIS